MKVDKTKKVNVIMQLILATIPFGGLYAHWRIQKIQLGILVHLLSVGCVILPALILPDVESSDDVTVYSILMSVGVLGWFVIPYYFLYKWSDEWNKRIDNLRLPDGDKEP